MLGAIAQALAFRNDKERMAAHKRNVQAAVQILKDFGCEPKYGCTEDNFEYFALDVANNEALKQAIAKAWGAGIKVFVIATGSSSNVINDEIYIQYDNSPEKTIEFLTGEKPS